MEHKKIELKPCPFCGCEVKIKIYPSTLYAVARCEKCSVEMNKAYKGHKRIEEVLTELLANDWNGRADDGLSGSD